MSERGVRAVPRTVLLALAVSFAAHVAVQLAHPRPLAGGAMLPEAPAPEVARVCGLDEPIATAQLMALYLQAFDNQPGISIPYRALDYGRVARWLDAAVRLDPRAQYPLLMAAHLYAQVPDEAKQRSMLDYVHRRFLEDPERRWRWLAHGAIMAKHRLGDQRLALLYARDIARFAPQAPGWARQMQIFLLEEMGELQSATVLLGGLLASGELTDPKEVHFLSERLRQLKKAEKSSRALGK